MKLNRLAKFSLLAVFSLLSAQSTAGPRYRIGRTRQTWGPS